MRPQSALGWWAFGLCALVAAWGVGFPFLLRLGPLLARTGLRIPLGFGGAMMEVVWVLAAAIVTTIALRRGERSRLLIAVAVAAGLVGGFWMIFIGAEMLFPH